MALGDFLWLLLLSAIWGSSFLLIRIGAPIFDPVVLVELRVSMAALVLLAIILVSRQARGQWRRYWPQFLVLGTLNSVIPFTLIAVAELHLSASLAAILNATTPLFTSIVAIYALRERFSLAKFVGLLLGVGGVGILVGWSPAELTPINLLSIGASLLAAISYAVAGVYIKRTFKQVPSLHLALGQQGGAALVMVPLVAAYHPVQTPTLTAWVAIIILAVLCTALAYLIYFHLMQQVGPTNTLLVTMIVPIFGVFWGMLLLNEQPTLNTWIGLGLIVGSVVFVTELALFRRQPSVAPRQG